MKKVLITGAGGFIGRNLVCELGRFPGEYEILKADVDTPDALVREYLGMCDFVVHLAGVNRPKDTAEFKEGNAGFTAYVLSVLEGSGNACPVAITSSIQAVLDNPYGESKLAAENAVLEYGNKNNVPVYVFRLPNVFGKWCRPNYNSAVATFCHNTAHGLEITVNDPERVMTLVYIDDVLDLIKSAIRGSIAPSEDGLCPVPVTHEIKLGEIASKLAAYHEHRKNLVMPPLETPLERALYSTYLSYLEKDNFSYPIVSHADERGMFAEFFKSKSAGQMSVSTTAPGITRGNHWHHTKVEKFLVVKGTAMIRFRHIESAEVIEYTVSASDLKVVDIPVGYTHSIVNLGDDELVTIIWANEIFDPERPDTYYSEV